ncbi:MAG TPA: ACT domain-containing protein [Pyrinomonadaceae bacterium]|nr:ACT domain-containing protein [Pyrinomonadaceae bacterium]
MSSVANQESVAELLNKTRVTVAPATYVIVSLQHQDWSRLLENPELSPKSDAPFMVFRDEHEVTLVIESDDWQRIRYAARDARAETEYRLVTLDVILPWNVVGYLARITEILAAANISVGVLSSFSRDHLLIKQADLGTALKVLGPHVAELC